MTAPSVCVWERLKVDFQAWVLRDEATGAALATVEQFRPDSVVWEWTAFVNSSRIRGIAVTPCLEHVFGAVENALAKAGRP
jgi:hypothetical protein